MRSPSVSEFKRARARFHQEEPRSLFYRAAADLIGLSLKGTGSLSIAECLGIVLQTWNVSFYRFHARFDEGHLKDIEGLLERHQTSILAVGNRCITSLTTADEEWVQTVFGDFEKVLGPIGASKALHLLARRFFPLWDREIASKGYASPMKKWGGNAEHYWSFMIAARKPRAKDSTNVQFVSTFGRAEDGSFPYLSRLWILPSLPVMITSAY
jgi:hypothetical protein